MTAPLVQKKIESQGSMTILSKLEDERRLVREIKELKKTLGESTTLLGHHYQRLGIIDVADHIGDSFGLAKKASELQFTKNIVFCGVRFMAESAAILCRDDQKVFHPEPEAGCPMADMAPMDSVLKAWEILSRLSDSTIIPVTYMNSHAPLKAFTGEKGGLVCTSSNAELALQWAFERGQKILFFPDQHLGRNTALKMGIKESEICVYYPSKLDGGLPKNLDKLKVILWNGNCPVHMKFYPRDLLFIRDQFPKAKIAVHPECTHDVILLSDFVGSTEGIVKWVQGLEPETQVFVGTEINLIERLRVQNPLIKIEALFRSLCPTMYKVNLQKVKSTLEEILSNQAQNKLVEIDSGMKNHAREALERMLSLKLPSPQGIAN
jgi:quinolinate synthase